MTAGWPDPHARTLMLVWAALLVLLALTFAAAVLPLSGTARAGLAFAIALAKAALIFWFFMHGKEVSGLVRLAGIAALLWIVILLTLTGADYGTRRAASGATFAAEPGRNRTSEAGSP